MEGKKEVKDKKVRVFKIETKRRDGYEIKVKHYLHDEDSGGIWAYVRDLTEREKFAALAVNVEQSIVFKITYNKKLTDDIMFEFNGDTYKKASADHFEFNKTDLVIRAEKSTPPAFDEVQYDHKY